MEMHSLLRGTLFCLNPSYQWQLVTVPPHWIPMQLSIRSTLYHAHVQCLANAKQ